MSNRMLDEDLISSIIWSIVEEDPEQAAILFLSIPREQRKVYISSILGRLRDKVEDWYQVLNELVPVEEVEDVDHPPSDLCIRLSALSEYFSDPNMLAVS